MPALPSFPKSYTVEIVRSDGARGIAYVDGWTQRLELYPERGQPTILICRQDKQLIWSLSPHTKTYSQTKIPGGLERVVDPDSFFDWREDGSETIDGCRCLKFIGVLGQAHKPVGSAHSVCFVDHNTGMRRRVIRYDITGKQALTTDFLKPRIGPPPSDIFEVPADYKRGYPRRQRADG